MSDALSVLRRYVSTEQPITLDTESAGESASKSAGDIVMGSFRFPRKTKTALRSSGRKKEQYELDALWFLTQNSSVGPGVYIRLCTTQGIQKVSSADKKLVLAYLKGKSETCGELLDFAEQQQQQAASSASGASLDELERAPKKRRLDGNSFDAGDEDMSALTLERVRQRNIPVATRSTALQSTGTSFAHVVGIFDRSLKAAAAAAAAASAKRKAEKKAAAAGKNGDKRAGGVKRKLSSKDIIPIILVPAAPSALVTLYNVRQLLQHHKFVPSEAVQAESHGVKPQQPLVIEMPSKLNPKKKATFHIIDDISLLQPGDWPRVVGVMVLGKAWQFTGFPSSDPAVICDEYCAMHLNYKDAQLHPNITKWRLHKFQVHRERRHHDTSLSLDIWKLLVAHMASRRKHLFY